MRGLVPCCCAWLVMSFGGAAIFALPAFTEAGLQAWWKSRPSKVDYAEEATRLKSLLGEAQNAQGVDLNQLSQHPDFLGWLDLACWLDLYPKSPGADFLGSPEGRAAFSAVGANSALRKLFLGNVSVFDDATKACEILCRIVHSEPAHAKILPQAAVAMALVWDQPFPEKWPHLWARKTDLPIGDSDPVKRFHAFCQIHQGVEISPGVRRKFLVDATRLTVRDLMFVIDTPLDFKELNYIIQVKLTDPRRLSDLFQQVHYDATRMNREDLMWPHGSYRLIDIGKKGGICADQAYFVSMAGKAQGIPSVVFMGQGSSGGHAWVGYMGAPGKWTLNVAKYKEGHFTSGSTWDPQTWRRITDAQLAFMTGEPGNSPAALRGRLLSRWAVMNRSSELYPRLLGIARTAWLRNIDIWELQAACLEERNIPTESRRVFWEKWIASFKEDQDMRFRGQTALLKLYESIPDLKAAEELRNEIVNENKHGRFDLAISLSAAPVLDLVAAGKWNEAGQSCEKLLRQSKSKANGSLFYNLVQPFIERAVQADQIALARTILDLAKPLFEIVPLSTLAVDFKTLEGLLKER
jgi:hypothetical protein